MEGITGKYIDSDCSLVLPAPLARDPALAVKDFEMSERVTSKLWKAYQAKGGVITEKGSNSSLLLDFLNDPFCQMCQQAKGSEQFLQGIGEHLNWCVFSEKHK